MQEGESEAEHSRWHVCICKYHITIYSTLASLHARPSQAKSEGIVPLLKAKNNILTSRGQRSSQGNSSWELQDFKNLEETEFNKKEDNTYFKASV